MEPSLIDKSILVVEDNGLIALNSYELLTKLGYSVPGMFSSGEDLLEHLEKSSLPDLILMDITLSGQLDGIETARMVRQRYDVPVIFLTAYSDNSRMEEAGEVSPYGYIVKPFVEHQLIETIKAVLSGGPYYPAE
jgi:CheY-like chemotaxis protein